VQGIRSLLAAKEAMKGLSNIYKEARDQNKNPGSSLVGRGYGQVGSPAEVSQRQLSQEQKLLDMLEAASMAAIGHMARVVGNSGHAVQRVLLEQSYAEVRCCLSLPLPPPTRLPPRKLILAAGSLTPHTHTHTHTAVIPQEFKHLDQNGDGFIDRDEWEAAKGGGGGGLSTLQQPALVVHPQPLSPVFPGAGSTGSFADPIVRAAVVAKQTAEARAEVSVVATKTAVAQAESAQLAEAEAEERCTSAVTALTVERERGVAANEESLALLEDLSQKLKVFLLLSNYIVAPFRRRLFLIHLHVVITQCLLVCIEGFHQGHHPAARGTGHSRSGSDSKRRRDRTVL